MPKLTKAYKDYINSPRWKAKREKYFDAKGRWCKACRSHENIKIHHLSYDNFGHEPLMDLVSLCNSCHVKVHQLHRKAGGRPKDLRTITNQYIKNMTLKRLRPKTPRR
jgi:CRISPR/Cas system-associated protein Cas10 (large subunit of type III CRISPR-Cas system)